VEVCRLVSAVFAALMLQPSAIGSQAPPVDPVPCTFPAAEISWLQRALDGWEQVSRQFLRLDPSPLPWIVLFDAACVWHLSPDASVNPDTVPAPDTLSFAGRSVPVRTRQHKGTVLLPTGAPIVVEMKASTSLYRNGRGAFFVMAMPSVWQTKDVSAPTRAEYLHGVFSHEMTHTRLLVDINRRVRELARKNDLVYPINDDVIQAEFRRTPGFEAAFNREREQFYRAALETDPAKRLDFAAKALEMVRQRQARYFTGPTAAYAELESLFLTMEGVGQWAAYRLAQTRAGGNDAEALRLVRDNKRYWSQDEGLALFLLIDAMVPGWQPRVFAPTPASPFALLEEAVAGGTGPAKAGRHD
jgi:hypothetical protein